MSDLPPPEPLYLQCEPDPVFMTLHLPRPEAARGTGVLMCPPFGWEEICAYRSLRAWAPRLAGDGYAALRLSLPATGDSGGDPRSPHLLDAWVDSVIAAAAWLRDRLDGRRITSLGIGLGGLLSCLATARGASIDDLVLGATPAHGATLVRQVRAAGRFERSLFYDDVQTAPTPLEGKGEGEGGIEAGGFLLGGDTAAALSAVDLAAVTIAAGESRRALLLEPAGTGEGGAALGARLRELGLEVSIAPGDGLADMTSHPQGSNAPPEVVDRVSRWLDDDAPRAVPTSRPVSPTTAGAGPSASIRLRDGMVIRETAVSVPQPFGQLAGVLAEPAEIPPDGEGSMCVVLLNAGAIRRIGPSRMWVEASRRWAANGIPVLRLDLKGIGDADGDGEDYADDTELYAPAFVPQVLAALDFLQDRQLATRFTVGGLCSGAYWTFHSALRDTRVSNLLLVNPRALIWVPGLGPRRDLRALFSERPTLSRLRRNVTGPRLRAVLYWLAGTPAELLVRLRERDTSSVKPARRLDASLESLLASGGKVMLLFSEREPLRDELVRTGTWNRLEAAENVTIERVTVRDHTMRPVWAQREAHEALDRAVLDARVKTS